MDLKFLARVGRRAGFFALSLLAVVYMIFQISSGATVKVDSEFVAYVTARKTLTLGGYIFRDELTLYSSADAVSPILGDGDKANKEAVNGDNGAKVREATVLAYLYSGGDADTLRRLKTLDGSIMSLEAVKDGHYADRESSLRAISKIIAAVFDDVDDRRFPADMNSAAIYALTAVERDMASSGKLDAAAYNAALAALNSQRSSLLSGVRVEYLRAPVTGNYYSYSDGAEGVFDYGRALEITSSDFRGIINSAQNITTGGNAGKIVLGSRWYYCAMISGAQKLRVGGVYNLNISGTAVNVTLERLVADYSTGETMLIFGSDAAVPEIIGRRYLTAELTVSSASGYKLPSSSIRSVDGVTGVYVVSGNKIYFRAVAIRDEIDNYVVIWADSDKGTELRESELVVIKGKELYNGKFIR